MIRKGIQSALTISLGVAAFAATAPAVHAQEAQAGGGLEQVFVTARKRDEGVQSVPISIAALSADALADRNVREIQDLNTVVPGFRFGAEGGKGNNNIVMRGLSKIPLGEGIPAVVTYFANIALPARGGNIPAYDIANIQVLKGPQGTLFGRNTLGGAVVITPEAPSYELGGYIKGDYGTKDYRNLEGAINVPIVDEKVALRIAGQIRRQDGLSRNLSGGPDFDDIHQNSYRISLLLNPTDNVESTTVYDHFQADEVASTEYLLHTNPALDDPEGLGAFSVIPAANSAIPGAPKTFADQIRYYVAQAHSAGYHAAFTDLPNAGFVKRNLWGVSNDTSWDTGVATVRNIFGYRRVGVSELINTGAVGPTTAAIPNSAPYNDPAIVGNIAYLAQQANNAAFPFTIFHAAQTVYREYWSDEFQVFGNAWDDRLDWIVGLFYNKDQSTDPQGTTFTQFSPFGTEAPAITAHVKNENQAVFAQTGLDLSQWTVEGLKLNVGARYSEDKVSVCGGSNGTENYMGVGECKSQAALGNPYDGIGTASTNDQEMSWTLGLDWQINPDTLVYITSRRGYRGANVNTPVFETPYTTGATPAQAAASPLGTTFGPCAIGATPVTCPDLRGFQKTDPEKLTDVEIGVKNDWSIGDVKGRIDLAAYISKYKDAVQFLNVQSLGIPNGVPDTPSSASVGVNAADLTIKGVEADLTVVPVPSLTLTFSGAYTDQDIDKIAPPSGGLSLTKDEITLPSPKFSGTFAFAWTLPLHPLDGDLILNGDYFHTESFGAQGGVNFPGYDVANFRLSWKGVAKTNLDLAAYVKNAFDEDYLASPIVLLTAFPVSSAIPGDPRTWGVEASYKF